MAASGFDATATFHRARVRGSAKKVTGNFWQRAEKRFHAGQIGIAVSAAASSTTGERLRAIQQSSMGHGFLQRRARGSVNSEQSSDWAFSCLA